MSLFDFNVAVGRFAGPVGIGLDTPESLLAEMDRLGIGEALVYHALAAEADIEKGNHLLLDAIARAPRLHPCWVVAPRYLADLPDPDLWINDAVAGGVRAVRAFPRYHLYGVNERTLGPMCAALGRAGIPLILDFGGRHWSERAIPWHDVRLLADQFRDLPIVVVGPTVGDVREVDATLRSSENVHIECHALIPPDLYSQMANAGFSGRLVFGTGMPMRAGECSVSQLVHSGLNATDFGAVSGGTARKLLKLQDKTATTVAAPTPPLPSDVIDVHAHIGSWERTTTPVKGPEEFVVSMDRCGISKMVFSSFSAIHGETRYGNQETADAVRRFPSRLYGYCVINPNFPGESAAELARCFEHARNFVGLKFHCQLHGAQLHDPGYEIALVYANDHSLPVLVHGGGQDHWDDVAAAYPNASIIMAHACTWDGRDPGGRALYERVATTANLFVDVAGSPAHRGAMRALIDLVGVEKVLFGSDFPMFDLAFELGRVAWSEISIREKRSICSDNALRIFRRIV